MIYSFYILYLFLGNYVRFSSLFSASGKDVCFGQQGHLSCSMDEVIMMTSAEYGHMAGGSCIAAEDPRYRGCSNDVLSLFDKWCSGKQECHFDTSNKELEGLNKNCPVFIIKYTRLEHSCIKSIFYIILIDQFSFYANITNCIYDFLVIETVISFIQVKY